MAFPTFVAFWASAVSAAVIAYLIGRPILKLKGYFLALATLGFGEIFLVIVRESTDLTGGVIGIFGIPWFSVMGFSFDTYLKQYYLTWGVLIGLFIFSKNLVRSKMGRALLAVAASEDAASSVGINVARIKLEIFVLGAAFAGLAGSLFACVMSTANPEAFSLGLSVLIVMMVILGGMGNLYGPICRADPPHLAHGYPGQISGIQPPHLRRHLDPAAHLLPRRYWNPLECQADLPDRLLGEKEEERRGKTLMSLLSIEEITKEYDGIRALGPGLTKSGEGKHQGTDRAQWSREEHALSFDQWHGKT